MASAKPADFFLGVTEFFAILLPGAAFVYLIQAWALGLVPPSLIPQAGAVGWSVFLVMAYVAGHLLHAAGSFFDKKVYSRQYLRRFHSQHFEACELISQLTEENKLDSLQQHIDDTPALKSTLVVRAYLQAGTDSKGTSLYDWALSLVRLRNASAAAEVDRCQADSKFFRSLTVVLLLSVFVTAIEGFFVASLVGLMIMIFSAYRFCTLRWTATTRVYEYYLLLHMYPWTTNSQVLAVAQSIPADELAPAAEAKRYP